MNHNRHRPGKGTRESSSATIHEERNSNRRQPSIERDIESRRSYHLEDVELYTKSLSERQIPTVWKKAKMVIMFENYIPICLLSNIYKVLTKILTKRLEKTLDENQP